VAITANITHWLPASAARRVFSLNGGDIFPNPNSIVDEINRQAKGAAALVC